MRHCPVCGHPNEDGANICVLCKRSLRRHKTRWIRWGSVAVLSAFLVITLYAMEHFGRKAELSQGMTSIQLLSSAGYRTRSSHMVVEGKIRNISRDRLNGVVILASWYDSQGRPLSRDKVKLGADPFLNFSVASFAVKTPYKPGMENYAVAFELEDGTPLLAQDMSRRYAKSLP